MARGGQETTAPRREGRLCLSLQPHSPLRPPVPTPRCPAAPAGPVPSAPLRRPPACTAAAVQRARPVNGRGFFSNLANGSARRRYAFWGRAGIGCLRRRDCGERPDGRCSRRGGIVWCGGWVALLLWKSLHGSRLALGCGCAAWVLAETSLSCPRGSSGGTGTPTACHSV